MRVAAGRAGSRRCAAVAARGLRDQEAEREHCGVLGSPLRAASPAARGDIPAAASAAVLELLRVVS